MTYLKNKYDFLGGEVLLFDKSRGWTSFDLVQRIRNTLCREMGIKKLKVGHAGTLDPLASGLLIVFTGKATRLTGSFQEMEKEYIATLKLGATTPSYDLETPENSAGMITHITSDLIDTVLSKFKGETEQVPPLFSAVKIKGKRAFDYARKGEKLKLNPKKIVIKDIKRESLNLPFMTINVICSKGTYIRALARDIGKELHCGAYLTALRRTRIGEYKVEDAVTIDFFMDNIKEYVTN
jgi:tRNA pseudouridine55 synthase